MHTPDKETIAGPSVSTPVHVFFAWIWGTRGVPSSPRVLTRRRRRDGTNDYPYTFQQAPTGYMSREAWTHEGGIPFDTTSAYEMDETNLAPVQLTFPK